VHRHLNGLKTALLLGAMSGLVLLVGSMFGRGGLLIALVVALGMNAFAYWNSDQMVLRMSNAREVGPADAPELYGIVQQLAQRANMPMPKVYIVDEDQPNAFATGRSPEHAAVCANTGLLRLLSREEVTGVLAHELSHVRNRDTLTMTIAATLSGAIGMLASFGGFFGGGRDQNGNRLVTNYSDKACRDGFGSFVGKNIAFTMSNPNGAKLRVVARHSTDAGVTWVEGKFTDVFLGA